MLHTQTFWAFDASTLGSALVKATSLRPLMRTRLGTDAEIETDPVDVVPSDPCVAAGAVLAATTVRRAARPAW